MRIDLKMARWPDGSRAFLDSRGMLHLKSADPSLPELSLVLSNEKLAGWSSDGWAYGPAKLIGEARTATPVALAKHIEDFVVRLPR